MKNILVLLHDDAGQEARLQVALDVTRALRGHLTCLDVVQYPVIDSLIPVEGQALLLEDERQQEAANRSALRARLSIEDVSWSMDNTMGDLAACVTRAAGLADLIVLNRKLDDRAGPDMRDIATRVVLESGRPVLAVPEAARGLNLLGHAVVAWDGSMPAMAASTAAVPLLKLAASVSILEVGDETSSSAEEVAAYLSRHAIHASVERIAQKAGQSIAEAIDIVCQVQGAAYCVMGAYGHSRMREALFGGVTRRMLSSSERPLLLAH